MLNHELYSANGHLKVCKHIGHGFKFHYSKFYRCILLVSLGSLSLVPLHEPLENQVRYFKTLIREWFRELEVSWFHGVFIYHLSSSSIPSISLLDIV